MGILDLLTNPSQYLAGILNAPASDDTLPGEADINVSAPDPYTAYDIARAQRAADAERAAAARTIFDTGAPAVPAAGISGQQAMTVGPFGSLAPVLPSPPVAPAAAPAPASLPVAAADIPLPRPRPAAAPQPISTVDDTTMPANATPTIGQGAPPTAPAPAVPPASLAGRLGQMMVDADSKIAPHTATLLALAGGLAGAPSWGTGISRGLTAAAAALPMDQKLAMQNVGIQQTYKALVQSGVPPQLALASVYNPSVLQSTLQNYVTDRKAEIKTVKGPFGEESIVAVNPYDLSSKTISGAGTSPGAGGQPEGANGLGVSFYAPGYSAQNVDLSKSGDDFLNQFSPLVQQAVHAYINGDTMPSFRSQGAMQQIKMIAQKYGQDIGTPADDTTYIKRRQFQQQYASNQPNTFGGQAKAFHQALNHMTTLADVIEKYGPSGGAGIAPVAHMINSARELGTGQADIANQINAGAQSTAGEIGKLFSGSSGGGVHEREATRGRFASINSGPEAAGSLEATLELMQGGLNALQGHANEVMGSGAPQVMNKDDQAKIDHIRGVIARLRGQQAAEGAAPPASQGGTSPMQISTKAQYDALPKGSSYVAPDGSVRTKQ